MKKKIKKPKVPEFWRKNFDYDGENRLDKLKRIQEKVKNERKKDR